VRVGELTRVLRVQFVHAILKALLVAAQREHIVCEYFQPTLYGINLLVESVYFPTEVVYLLTQGDYLCERAFPDWLRLDGTPFRLGLQSFHTRVQVIQARLNVIQS